MHRTVRRPWDTSGYVRIVTRILGDTYDLSLVLIGDTRARALNRTYRAKNTPANVLSFPLTPHSGEIFLNLARITREARHFDHTPAEHARYLLIHGCLHLKGYDHGSRMERAERDLCALFAIR